MNSKNSHRETVSEEVSTGTVRVVVVLVALLILGIAAVFSTKTGQEMVGIRIEALSSSADYTGGVEKAVFNCIAEPCVPNGDNTNPTPTGVINCIAAPCPGSGDQNENGFGVISPAGQEEILVGQTLKIKWSRGNYENIRAEKVSIALAIPLPDCVHQDPPCQVKQISPLVITKSTDNDGAYDWVVPSNLADAFVGPVFLKLQILDSEIYAGSNVFSIVKVDTNQPIFTAPAGTDVWKAGTAYAIKWSGNLIGPSKKLTIAPWRENEDKVGTIISNIGPLATSYNWKVPSDLPEEYYNGPVVIRLTTKTNAIESAKFWLSRTPQQALEITTLKLPAGTNATTYSFQITAIGGVAPYRWSIDPGTSGLSINQNTGELSGTPNPGSRLVRVTVRDAAAKSVSKKYTLMVQAQPPVAPHGEGSLVLGLNNIPTSVWLIVRENGMLKRKPFPSAEVFLSHGYQWDKIVPANKGDAALFISEPMSLASGTLVKDSRNQKKYYVIYPGKIKRQLSSMDVLTGMGYRTNAAYQVNLSGYSNGDPITAIEAHAPGSDLIDPHSFDIYRMDSYTSRLYYPNMIVYDSWHTTPNDTSHVWIMNEYDMRTPQTGDIKTR